MFISSSDYEFMVNLYNGLIKLKNFEFVPDLNLYLEHVILLIKSIPVAKN